MPNAIKYSTTGDTLSLKKGNIFFGVGDVGKGPSSATTYYNGVTPPTSGYTIYSYNSGQTSNLSFYTAVDDISLREYTNNVSGGSFATAAQCLNWYATQTNYVCVNRDYESITTDGLILNLDAGFTPSYTTSGTTWYDLSYSGRTATLTNGPIYTGTSGGAFIMDGVDDKITISSGTTEPNGITLGSSTSPWMVNVWIKTTAAGSDSLNTFPILTNKSGGPVISSMGVAAGGVMKYAHYNGTWIVDKGTIPINDGNWHMLTWVNLNNNTMNLYVDGVFDRNISSIISGGGNINPVDSIGYGWAGYLNCTIATVAIYKRSTSYSTYEVQQNFNAQKSRFGL